MTQMLKHKSFTTFHKKTEMENRLEELTSTANLDQSFHSISGNMK